MYSLCGSGYLNLDILFKILNKLMRRWCLPHSRDEETKDQCSDATCPRPHTKSVMCGRVVDESCSLECECQLCHWLAL